MGAGNFSLPLLARGLTGTGVESHSGAVLAAGEAARSQGLGFEELLAEDALAVARRFSSERRAFDAVIVDPPRAGLKTGAALYAALARHTLVACSCNPRSLARDVVEICRLGFDVQSVTLFDMFPHTDHIEAVVWLARG
jgi:23S rRNA (uracil1939-C5)-methyltransferase